MLINIVALATVWGLAWPGVVQGWRRTSRTPDSSLLADYVQAQLDELGQTANIMIMTLEEWTEELIERGGTPPPMTFEELLALLASIPGMPSFPKGRRP